MILLILNVIFFLSGVAVWRYAIRLAKKVARLYDEYLEIKAASERNILLADKFINSANETLAKARNMVDSITVKN